MDQEYALKCCAVSRRNCLGMFLSVALATAVKKRPVAKSVHRSTRGRYFSAALVRSYMEIAEGVYSLPWHVEQGGETRTFTSSAIERDDGSLVLVDTALPGQLDGLVDALAEHDFTLDDISLVVLTHHDSDHAGALSALREKTEVEVLAHLKEAPYIEGEMFPIKTPEENERYSPARIDIEVTEDVVISTAVGPLQVVETPGHTPGHVSLYLPERRLLLAGDALTAADGEVQRPKDRFTPDMDRAMRSVEKLAALDVNSVVAFHGGYVEVDGDDIDVLTE